MKVKLRKCKKSPAQSDGEQVNEVSTIEKLRKTISFYGFPRKIIFDNYKPATSKSNWYSNASSSSSTANFSFGEICCECCRRLITTQ